VASRHQTLKKTKKNNNNNNNLLKPPYFSLNIRLLFLIYFGSGFEFGFESGFESGSETGSEMFITVPNRIRIRPSFGSLRIRIRFRIRNTGFGMPCHEENHSIPKTTKIPYSTDVYFYSAMNDSANMMLQYGVNCRYRTILQRYVRDYEVSR
jgi:hypothetical protein